MKTLRVLQRAVEASPSDPAAWLELGNAHAEREEYDDAIRCLRRAVRVAPDRLAPRMALARALELGGRPEDAAEELRGTIVESPDAIEPRQRLGDLLSVRLDRPQDGLRVFADAARGSCCDGVNFGFAISFLTAAAGCGSNGDAAVDPGPLDAAQSLIEPLVGPQFARLARAIALARHGRYVEAREYCREMLEREPTFALALATLGHIEGALGNVDSGLVHARAAFQAAPEDALVQGLYIRQLLWCGDYETAAAHLAHCGAFLSLASRARGENRWTGQPVRGKTLLVHARAGYGDTFNFIRAAGQWRDRGSTVFVQCRRKIAEIVSHVDGVAGAFAPYDDEDVSPDYEVDLAWSWLRLHPSLERIGDCVPYIHVPRARIEHWQKRLASTPGLRVGVVWAGEPVQYSPFHTRQSPRNRAAFRSVPVELLQPLADVRDVQLFSLQVGNGSGAEFGRSCNGHIVDLAPDVASFCETAAAIMALDAVVSADTSIAHLAGALGTPVLLMLPRVACWRWLAHRCDSPWYPTARLFRQQAPGDWRSVVADVAGVLRQMATIGGVRRAAPAACGHTSPH